MKLYSFLAMLGGYWIGSALRGDFPGPLDTVWAASVSPFIWCAAFAHGFLHPGTPWTADVASRINFQGGMLALVFWLFPAARLLRWIGCFDPFEGSPSPLRPLLRGWVWLANQHNMRLFGSRKTGGWAGLIEIFSYAYGEGDLFLGRSRFLNFGGMTPIGLDCRTHAVSFGSPGSGKSSAAAVPNALLWSGSLLVFDPKGEVTRICFDRRGEGGNGVRGLGTKTFVVDPAGLSGKKKSRYNPFFEIAKESEPARAIRLIFNLCEGLIKNPGGEDSWCYSEARAFLVGLVAHVLTTAPEDDRHLLTLRRLLVDGDLARQELETLTNPQAAAGMTAFDALLASMLEAEPGPFQHLITGAASTLLKMGDRQRGSVLTAATDATVWLDLPDYQDTVTGCDFLLRDFQTERMSVFVCLPLNELKGFAAGFSRLFLCLFTDTMFRALAPPKHRVLTLVDEFPAFGHIDRFCDIGPQMRSYGVMLWCLCQDLGQLRAAYPKEWEGFIGCAEFVQFFSVTHGETVDYLVRRLGEHVVLSRTPEGRKVEKPVLLLDLEQLPRFLASGNQIIWRGKARPLRLKSAAFWWFLPYWMYTPDPMQPRPEKPLKAWLRRRAVQREGNRRGLLLGRFAASAGVFGIVVLTLVLLALATSCGQARRRADAFLSMPDHSTPLVEAVKRRDKVAAERYADGYINKLDSTEIDYAVKVAIDRDDIDMANWLFSFSSQLALMPYAARTGHLAICERLVLHRSVWSWKDGKPDQWRDSEAQFRKDVVRYCRVTP